MEQAMEMPAKAPPGSWRWPLIVIGMLLTHALIMAGLVVYAVSDPGFAVEPDYYAKGESWAVTQRERAASESLGWQSEFQLASEADGAVATLKLIDKSGAPVNQAQINVELFPHLQARRRQHVTLFAVGDGRYTCPVLLDEPGVWEARITARRARDVYSETILTTPIGME
ncbi:MAG: FixH family protein [Phycisphaerales bacterium]|nr:FixH family protein [Phycisphaerales bacterium]